MVILSHPTGNANVRAVLHALDDEKLLSKFYTTLAVHRDDWLLRLLPSGLRSQAVRRAYDIRHGNIVRFPQREILRHAAKKLQIAALTRHETGWASVDAVNKDLDCCVAQALNQQQCKRNIQGVYCYEDCALKTFQAAKELGWKCIYDLPIAYWQTSAKLLSEEVLRWPEWEPTLGGTRDSVSKRERKTQELALADMVITPSRFVYDSLPETIRGEKKCLIAEFGSPNIHTDFQPVYDNPSRPLRVLFVGSMTQRKGLADLFAAVKQLNRQDVELIVMGSPVVPMEFYRSQYSDFRYEPPRPHAEVLHLMQSCDVLALPSIVEGRALVQQEAMACRLPLIVTANAGGEDLIEEGKTGFLVPIRSSEIIAEKIDWLADHREQLVEMKINAQKKALEYTWEQYGRTILSYITDKAN